MADQVLTDAEVGERLAALDGWELAEGAIRRHVELADFSEAFGFMARVALLAEKADHHPDWSNSWNKVDIAITNHSAGGVTQRCIDLAAAIDAVA
jgi:4a-hydroxytetrahydrobiopterin dehydratase